jgi:hypothetical protein
MLHIKAHIDAAPIGLCIDNILNKKGNVAASIGLLSGHHEALAIYSWFSDGDIFSTRNNFYISARWAKMGYEIEYDYSSPGYYIFELLQPLISNESGTINWFANSDFLYDRKKSDNHKTADFYAYQAILAINGRWEGLIERSERVLQESPKSAQLISLEIDHRFYLALARGISG